MDTIVSVTALVLKFLQNSFKFQAIVFSVSIIETGVSLRGVSNASTLSLVQYI